MLRLLTFNISGGNVSALSPPSFGPLEKYQAIVELVRRHAPHVVALQEVPEFGPLAATLAGALADDAHGPPYKLAASTESHCGLCQLFVQEQLRPTGGKAVGPIALCKIPLPLPPEPAGGEGGAEAAAAAPPGAVAGGGADAAGEAATEAGEGSKSQSLPVYLYVAGCHLEPFAEGAPDRLQQIDALLREVPPRARIVLAGDTNMRVKENAAVEGLGLTEAWQQVGAPKSEAYSWNTQINRYYGEDSRAYTARYDRVYVRGLEAASYRLVANKPLTPAGDFLSDHFGLLCELRVPPGRVVSPPPKRAGAAAAKRQRLSPGASRAAAAGHSPVRLFG